MSIQDQPTQVAKKPINLKSVASVVPSVIAIASSVLSVLCSLLAALCLTYDAGSVHLTTEAALVIFGYIVVMGFGFLFGGAGCILGVVGVIITLVNKRFKLIWIPILAVVLGIVGVILMAVIGIPAEFNW